MARALRLLAQREHSRAELERKLLTRAARDRAPADNPGGDDDALPTMRADVSRVLDELQRDGWLNDQRAAEALVQARAPRYGARRIGQLLRERAFDPELVAQSLASARASELERAREVWARRFERPPGDARERARQMRFLIGRGFDAQTAARVLRGNAADDDAAPVDDPGA